MSNTAQQLKQFQTQLTANQAELNKAKQVLSDAQRAVEIITQTSNRIKKEMNDIRKKDAAIIVSEHAIIRYMQRVMGINLKELETQICPPDVSTLAKQMRSGKFPVSGSHQVIVENGTVVTVWAEGQEEER